MKRMPESTQEFYRIQKLPPYVFAVINEMRAKARAAQQDVIDLGMGNPDGATPRIIVNKMIEAARNPRNHRYSQSKGIAKLREELEAASAVCAELGGRVHLVKNVCASPEQLHGMYTQAMDAFLDLKKRLDPDGILRNNFFERVFGYDQSPAEK